MSISRQNEYDNFQISYLINKAMFFLFSSAPLPCSITS